MDRIEALIQKYEDLENEIKKTDEYIKNIEGLRFKLTEMNQELSFIRSVLFKLYNIPETPNDIFHAGSEKKTNETKMQMIKNIHLSEKLTSELNKKDDQKNLKVKI